IGHRAAVQRRLVGQQTYGGQAAYIDLPILVAIHRQVVEPAQLHGLAVEAEQGVPGLRNQRQHRVYRRKLPLGGPGTETQRSQGKIAARQSRSLAWLVMVDAEIHTVGSTPVPAPQAHAL